MPKKQIFIYLFTKFEVSFKYCTSLKLCRVGQYHKGYMFWKEFGRKWLWIVPWRAWRKP